MPEGVKGPCLAVTAEERARMDAKRNDLSGAIVIDGSGQLIVDWSR